MVPASFVIGFSYLTVASLIVLTVWEVAHE